MQLNKLKIIYDNKYEKNICISICNTCKTS